jgi:hypothetical protein
MIRDIKLKLMLEDSTISFLEVKEDEEKQTLLIISQGSLINSFVLNEEDKKELIKVLKN